MTKESTKLLSHHIIDVIFNRLNLRLSEKGGLEKHSYLKYAVITIIPNKIHAIHEIHRSYKIHCN